MVCSLNCGRDWICSCFGFAKVDFNNAESHIRNRLSTIHPTKKLSEFQIVQTNDLGILPVNQTLCTPKESGPLLALARIDLNALETTTLTRGGIFVELGTNVPTLKEPTSMTLEKDREKRNQLTGNMLAELLDWLWSECRPP